MSQHLNEKRQEPPLNLLQYAYSKKLTPYQVGDNDIVAAYDEKQAIKILCEYSGCLDADDFKESDVTDLTSKLNGMLKDEDGNDLETLGNWIKRIDKPEYMYGWE